MRLLHFVESLDRGGLERVVCDLALEQARRGHFVEVLCLFTRGEFADELDAAGVRVLQACKTKGLDWAALTFIRKAVRNGRYELIHTHNPVANYYACLAELTSWRHLPIVNTRHNMGASNPADRREKLFRLSIARTAKVAMVSPQVSRKFVASGVVPAAKAAVIMNGIPLQRYTKVDEMSRTAARSRLGVPQDALLIGSVGRLVGVKNHALLLAATAPLRNLFPSLRVMFIGDGDLRSALQQQASELGLADVVHFAGERADVPEILCAFDIFVMPSLSEGHSIALLEAACTGLPAVATAVGGNPEIIQDGSTGLLVQSKDASALQEALEKLLANKEMRQDLGANALLWAQANVSVNAMADHYQTLYLSAIRPGTS